MARLTTKWESRAHQQTGRHGQQQRAGLEEDQRRHGQAQAQRGVEVLRQRPALAGAVQAQRQRFCARGGAGDPIGAGRARGDRLAILRLHFVHRAVGMAKAHLLQPARAFLLGVRPAECAQEQHHQGEAGQHEHHLGREHRRTCLPEKRGTE
jgi:hypothetical protein